MKDIIIYNHGNLPTANLEDFHELQEDFKLYDPDKNVKLQMLIITRGFKYAFKAWKDETGKLWIIDAHQRKRALQELKKAGFNISKLPYEPIQALNKREAVEEIAAYNSEFGKRNNETKLFEKYDIGTDDLAKFNLGLEHEQIDFENKESLEFSDQEIIESDIPEVRKEIISLKDDIWLLGHHRLMCGDSTKMVDVVKLMNKRVAQAIITDPPYNVAYVGGTEDALTIENDDMSSEEFGLFLMSVHKNMYKVAAAGASLYVFHADTEGMNFRKAFTESGFKLAQCLIWVKNQFVMGRQDYQWKHEPILYGWKPTAGHNWYGNRKSSTVIEFDKPFRNGEHPTMKPVGLVAILIKNSTKKLDIIADFFGGSGTTLMACEQMERICRIMEKDPKYSDVIVRRFISQYPDARIELIRNNKTFTIDELKARIPAVKASQSRIVSREDLLARVYTMPSNFGRVFRAAVHKSETNPLATELYIVSRDQDSKLTLSPDNLKNNLSTFINEFRLTNDAIDILDARIINILIDFDITAESSVNKQLVKQLVIEKIKQPNYGK